jgi:glycosyltransferase involved in cell wall biosynthesis
VHPAPDRTEVALAQGLLERGIQVTVLARRRVSPDCSFLDGRLRYFPIHALWDVPAVRFLRRTVKQGAFDIAHVFTSKACIPTLLAVKGPNRPKVVWSRGAILRPSRFAPRDHLRYFNGVDCIVACSEAVRRSLVACGIPSSRTVTIHNGHDPRWYGGPTIDLRKRLGIPRDVFVVGAVANARKAKGLEHLIRAASLLGKETTRMAIIIVGRDRGRRLSKAIRRLARDPRGTQCAVYLAGHIPDAFRVMKSFDCLVCPSVSEGFGTAVIEAMSQALPVIATRVGGLPEVVEHERSGLLIPPASPPAIADAVRRLAADPGMRRALGLAGRGRIMEKFTARAMVDETIRTYRGFLR